MSALTRGWRGRIQGELIRRPQRSGEWRAGNRMVLRLPETRVPQTNRSRGGCRVERAGADEPPIGRRRGDASPLAVHSFDMLRHRSRRVSLPPRRSELPQVRLCEHDPRQHRVHRPNLPVPSPGGGLWPGRDVPARVRVHHAHVLRDLRNDGLLIHLRRLDGCRKLRIGRATHASTATGGQGHLWLSGRRHQHW